MGYYSGILLLYRAQSIFDTASPEAEKIKHLTNGFIVVASAILLLVIILTIYIAIKYRAAQGTPEPKQFSGNRKMEILMVGVPLLLVVIFFFWSVGTMSAVLPDAGSYKPEVIITGHQWWWEASYPGKNVLTANEIHLPVGRKILVQLHAVDVIHDWWVPALSGKMDMIPGTTNHLWMTISKPGRYDGACAEFCGQQHAWMRILVVAQNEADYEQWLKEHAQTAANPQDTLARAGEALFMHSTCRNCHSIRGTGANGVQGPDLTHFGSRETMLAGMLQNNKENLYNWLSDPQKVKPGAHMPRFIFGKDSIRALTAYLAQLK